MTYFQCSVTGKGNTVIVTCDSEFAGTTVTFTNGTKTYIRTCPSSSPYEIEFNGIEAGTWTVSAVEGGVTYSYTFLVKDGVALLTHGFNWRTWVTAGGLDPDDYDDLDDVLSDEARVRMLMLKHASADVLIEGVESDLDSIDPLVENDTAMKWIGLCDYICDGLEAIDGVVAKFLASDYWERYLKDHVPIMTSNTAPYGTAMSSSNAGSQYPYYGFNGNTSNFWSSDGGHAGTDRLTYKFQTPICPKRFAEYVLRDRVTQFKIQGSNDGTNWVDLTDVINTSSESGIKYHDIDNDSYYLYLSCLTVTLGNNGQYGSVIYSLQFYGRAMSVSTPRMTGATAPYGTANSSGHISNFYPYQAFKTAYNPSDGTLIWSPSSSDGYVYYDFIKPVVCFMVAVSLGRNVDWSGTFTVIGSNDEITWDDISQPFSVSSLYGVFKEYSITCDTYLPYRYIGIREGNGPNPLGKVNFFGKDYSEKEFESGTDAVWLYDHGLDLATLTTAGTAVIGDEQITLSAANDQASKVVDLTDYSLIRAKVGDHMSGTTQIIASTTAVATLNANDAPNANGLNVSAVNQELDTGVKMTSAGTCDILELWLE